MQREHVQKDNAMYAGTFHRAAGWDAKNEGGQPDHKETADLRSPVHQGQKRRSCEFDTLVGRKAVDDAEGRMSDAFCIPLKIWSNTGMEGDAKEA